MVGEKWMEERDGFCEDAAKRQRLQAKVAAVNEGVNIDRWVCQLTGGSHCRNQTRDSVKAVGDTKQPKKPKPPKGD